jgi:DNA-binding response OmpR family regulator
MTPIKPTILIVDDEIEIIEIMTQTFRKKNYHILSAQTVSEATQQIQTHSIDVILLDIGLQHESGLDVLTAITDPKPEVIVISGYQDTNTIEQAKKLGANHYFIKPFLPRELRTFVNKVLETRNQITQPLKLLFIEDDLEYQETITMFLSKKCTLLQAYTYQESLSILKRESNINAIILDQTLPDGLGLTLLPPIRKKYPTIPIFFHTGFSESNLTSLSSQLDPFQPIQTIIKATMGIKAFFALIEETVHSHAEKQEEEIVANKY